MDVELEKKVNDAIEDLRKLSIEKIDFDQMDPVVKMMLVALLNEAQKIQDTIKNIPRRIAERFCTEFIPYDQIGAVPAVVLLNPTFRQKSNLGIVNVGAGANFIYRSAKSNLPLNYIPLFHTVLIPYSDVHVFTSHKLSYKKGSHVINMNKPNSVWVGIVTPAEIECLKGVSLMITGTQGILPEHIYVGTDNTSIEFCTMKGMENIEMVEPFDAQQSSGQFFSFVNHWKECLMNMDDAALLYFSDDTQDRDLFKPRAYPRIFQQWLEDDVLDSFDPNTLWFQLEFPEGYEVPELCNITMNILPVVNVDVSSLTLTQASPIAKLQKQEDSYFLKIIETSSSSHKQGFNMTTDEIIVRDFDASCYNNGDLYRDVRYLYNKFIDDYYAFITYNGIKDGEVQKQLRETINKLGKSVGETNLKYKFDSGTYVMKNMNQYPPTTSTKVSYMTTRGKIGNSPQIGDFMDNKKLPAIESRTDVIVSGMGGSDKATADQRYELLRYYTLTNDRLYTKTDIEAFLRKEIMIEFGKEEFKRIFVKINVEGTGGVRSLQRGLYIDIEFKDKKNYEKAVNLSFGKLMKQKIDGRSCISMPINVKLKNLEENKN